MWAPSVIFIVYKSFNEIVDENNNETISANTTSKKSEILNNVEVLTTPVNNINDNQHNNIQNADNKINDDDIEII